MRATFAYHTLFSLFALLAFQLGAFAQNGIIKGRVFEAKNNAPISLATVSLDGTSTAVTTDDDGYYEFTGLEPKLYNVSASYLGFQTKTEYELQVTNSKPVIMDFALAEEAQDMQTVEVKASPFNKTEESPVSLRTIGTAEIQRNPGGNRDISRTIRVLPGVTTVASFRNDLLIRGGAPNENRFFLDDVEVPNINHFATQGASGGPQGMINVDFIREVDFYSGAFPANRGNSLSSVFNFKQKNGRDDRLGFTFTSGTSDVALTLEGPLSKSKKTTFLFSVRQSYLQLLFKAIGLPFLPTYNDAQFKIRTQINPKSEFYVTGLLSCDRFKLNLDANETPSQRYILGYIPVNNQWSYAMGAVYKRYTQQGAWTFVLSRNMLDNKVFKHINNDESLARFIDYGSQESENKLRVENTSRYANGFKLTYGVGYEYVRYYNRTKDYQQVGNTIQPFTFESTLLFHKYYAFAQASQKLLKDRLVLSAGVRADGSSYNSEMANPFRHVSPRFSLAYAITEKLFFNFNTGLYYQLPAYTILGYKEDDALANKNRVKYIRASHVVAGFEYNTRTNAKISIEGYYKNYANYPFLINQGIALANLGGDFGIIGNAPVSSISSGRTYGLEVLVQQRLYKNFYGILAYTLGKAEFKDTNGNYVPSSWDSRHIVNMALGKEFTILNQAKRNAQNERRAAAGKSPIGRKLVPQNLQLGLNLRMQTGLPYTPFDLQASALTSNWNVRGQGIRNWSLLNTERGNLFYAVDFRIDYKWFFPKWSLNLYFDIQNLPGVASGQTELILEQGEDGNQPVQIVNQGQANESYILREIKVNAATSVPTLGIIFQY